MDQGSRPCLPVAVWYLRAEDGRPVGQEYRHERKAVPEIGGTIVGGGDRRQMEIMGFEELRASCAMRRFQVTVKVVG